MNLTILHSVISHIKGAHSFLSFKSRRHAAHSPCLRLGTPPGIRTPTNGFGDRYTALILGMHYIILKHTRLRLLYVAYEFVNHTIVVVVVNKNSHVLK
jgi:hypothetical protein